MCQKTRHPLSGKTTTELQLLALTPSKATIPPVGTPVADTDSTGDSIALPKEFTDEDDTNYGCCQCALVRRDGRDAGRCAPIRRPWAPCGILRSFPESRGTVRQYTLTPARRRGRTDPERRHGSEAAAASYRTGRLCDPARRRGFDPRIARARSIPLVDAASITNVATGKSVVDNGPRAVRTGAAMSKPTERQDCCSAAWQARRGERSAARGRHRASPAPPEAERLEGWLRAGQTVSVRGELLDTALGRVIDVRAIGSSPRQLTELARAAAAARPEGRP